MLDGFLFIRKCSHSPQPEHAGSKMSLSCGMLKQNSSLAHELANIEGVLHQQENVEVIRLWFSSNKRTEHKESSNMAGYEGQSINSFQPHCDKLALW